MGSSLTMPGDRSEATSRPLLEPDRLEAVVAVRDGQSITGAAMLSDAEALARRLPSRRYMLNFCEDRYNFICALAAALMRGQTTVLPQDRTSGTLSRIRAEHDSLFCATDVTQAGDLEHVEVDCRGGSDRFAREIPSLAGGAAAVKLFTSGTTGAPEAIVRSWDQLVAGVHLYRRSLGLDRLGASSVVATVPSQHSYGLEMAVLLQMTGHAAVDSRLPLYPADIAAALDGLDPPRVLVTTPIHLDTLVSSPSSLPPLALIVSATAPLSQKLAAAAERSFGAPLFEVYGCTEAGMVATRHTVEDEMWTLAPGMTVAANGTLRGPHLPAPVVLGDVLDIQSDRRFKLVGRKQDMINVAGNRASLSGLNAILCALDGVDDGAFYQSDEQQSAAGVNRLVAFVVAPGRDPAGIRRDLARQVAPAFLPRRILPVPQIPRRANGKIAIADLAALAQSILK